jgi:hypothetical protein
LLTASGALGAVTLIGLTISGFAKLLKIAFRWRIRTCIIASVAFHISVLCAILGYQSLFSGIPSAFAASDIGILIPKAEGDADDRIRNSLAQDIQVCLSKLPPRVARIVRIKYLERVLAQDPEEQAKEALTLGNRLKATFVIRLVPVVNGFQAWVTFINVAQLPASDMDAGRISREALAHPGQVNLTCDMGFLARCAFGLSLYKSGQWEAAAQELSGLLSASGLPSIGPSRAYLSFLLGNAYLEQRDTPRLQGDQRVRMAIASYDAALHEWSGEQYQRERGITLLRRGLAYWNLSGPDRAANLREAAASYDDALRILPPSRTSTEWRDAVYGKAQAQIESPLGAEPGYMSTILEAQQSLERLLAEYDFSNEPKAWAGVMAEIGLAHSTLAAIGGSQEAGLAIESYDRALRVYTFETYPREWAALMTNRGNVFSGLETGNREANVREAIRCHFEALKVRTKDSRPDEFTASSFSLGRSYLRLARLGNVVAYDQAILSFDHALEAIPADRQPGVWARVVISRAQAYAEAPHSKDLKTLKDGVSSLERAHRICAELNLKDLLADCETALVLAKRQLTAVERRRSGTRVRPAN